MSKIRSIFGSYADNMQLMIDRSKDKFAPIWHKNYFTPAPVQASLTYTTVIGRSRIEAAASVVNRDSQTPLRSRPGLEKLSGEIPAIKEAFAMKESDYRDFLVMQQMNVNDSTKKTQMLDFMFNDVKKVGDAALKRLDIMCLEAVSTGKISLTINNNPDGLVLADPIDLLMPEDNFKKAAVTWATAASATPITDIEAVVKAGQEKGLSFAKIQMSDILFSKFKKCKEVIDTMTAYFYGPKPGTGFNPIAVSTLDRINEFLSANRLPVIEIIDQVVGVEKNGKIIALRPFDEKRAAFIPSGPLGTIKNAWAIEETAPVKGVSYAKYENALISKFSENEPFQEWTKVELNAFPSFEAIDSVMNLEAVYTS